MVRRRNVLAAAALAAVGAMSAHAVTPLQALLLPGLNTFQRPINPGFLPAVSATSGSMGAAIKIVASWTGPIMQIVHPTLATTMDVYPTAGSQAPLYATIDAWTGGLEPQVSIIYDQYGLGHHYTQSGAAMPYLSKQVGSAQNGVRPIRWNYSGAGAVLGATTRSSMVIPNLGMASRNMGAAYCLRQRCTNTQQVLFEVYQGASGSTNNYYLNDWSGIQGPGSGLFPRANTQAVVFTSGSAGTTYTTNGVTVSKGTVPVTTQNTTGYLGHSSASGAIYDADFDLFAFGFYTTTPSGADATALQVALDSIFAPPKSGFQKQLIYGGSSLIASYGATAGNTSLFLMNLGDTWEQYNMGAQGKRLQDANTNQAVELALYSTGRSKIVHVIDAPHNDFAAGSFGNAGSASSFADNIFNTVTVPMCTAIKNAGGVPVVPTMIAGADLTTANFKEYARVEYNSKVRAGQAANGYIISERAQALVGGVMPLDVTPTTSYYFTDLVHLNDTGYAIMSALDKAAILSA